MNFEREAHNKITLKIEDRLVYPRQEIGDPFDFRTPVKLPRISNRHICNLMKESQRRGSVTIYGVLENPFRVEGSKNDINGPHKTMFRALNHETSVEEVYGMQAEIGVELQLILSTLRYNPVVLLEGRVLRSRSRKEYPVFEVIGLDQNEYPEGNSLSQRYRQSRFNNRQSIAEAVAEVATFAAD